MIAGYILLAVCAGAAAAVFCHLLDAPAWLVIAAYPAAGTCALLAAAGLRAWRAARSPAGAAELRPHVLAVDDDPLVLDTLAAILERPGDARITTASSAREAMALIGRRDLRFDGFLLDIVMRETDGIELVRHLRRSARYAQVPVVMLTRRSDLTHVERAFAAGATNYVVKPINPPELRYLVQALMQPGQGSEARGTTPIGVASPPRMVADFAEPVDLSHINGFLTADAAHTFMIRASESMESDRSMLRCRRLLFRLNDAEAHFVAAGPDGFFLALEQVARAFAFSVRKADAFLTYLGAGTFLLIARGGHVPEPKAIVARVNRFLARHADGGEVGTTRPLAVHAVPTATGTIEVEADV